MGITWGFSLQHIPFSSWAPVPPDPPIPSQAWPVAPPARTWGWWKKTSPVPAPLLSLLRKAVVNGSAPRKRGSKQKYSLESLFLGSGNDVKRHLEFFEHQLSLRMPKKNDHVRGFLPKEMRLIRSKEWRKITRPLFSKQDGKPHRTNS